MVLQFLSGKCTLIYHGLQTLEMGSSWNFPAVRRNPSPHKSLCRKKPLTKSLQMKIPLSKRPPHLNTSQQNTSRQNATQQNTYNLEKNLCTNLIFKSKLKVKQPVEYC